jgi:hypothetical protein
MDFSAPPSALAFMARAFLPRPRFAASAAVPLIRARWRGAAVPARAVADFVRLTGSPAGDRLPIVFPQAWAFRLQMAVLTHPAFPLPLWGALQIRNHLLQRWPIETHARFDIETWVAGQRALDKGLEVDLRTIVASGDGIAWEGLTTFYYRMRLNGGDAPSPLARSPDEAGVERARWSSGSGSGLRCGRLTGDYNGVHWSDAYARRFGFPRAFHHPQRVLGQALAHLPWDPGAPAQGLDAWLKGPVFYGSEVVLRCAQSGGSGTFALHCGAEPRPAIVGRWSTVSGDAALAGGAGSGTDF